MSSTRFLLEIYIEEIKCIVNKYLLVECLNHMLQYTYKRGYLRILLSDIKVKFSLSFYDDGKNLGGKLLYNIASGCQNP